MNDFRGVPAAAMLDICFIIFQSSFSNVAGDPAASPDNVALLCRVQDVVTEQWFRSAQESVVRGRVGRLQFASMYLAALMSWQ